MKTFRVFSESGIFCGDFEAPSTESAESALDSLARIAGYRDQAHAEEVCGRPFEGRVEEVRYCCECAAPLTSERWHEVEDWNHPVCERCEFSEEVA